MPPGSVTACADLHPLPRHHGVYPGCLSVGLAPCGGRGRWPVGERGGLPAHSGGARPGQGVGRRSGSPWPVRTSHDVTGALRAVLRGRGVGPRSVDRFREALRPWTGLAGFLTPRAAWHAAGAVFAMSRGGGGVPCPPWRHD